LVLLWQARQPVWLENSAHKVWRSVRAMTETPGGTGGREGGQGSAAAPLLIGVVGVLWALLPCGLLYSALLVAAMAGSVRDGAAVMALFALGSGVSLMAGPWLWLKFAHMPRAQGPGVVRFTNGKPATRPNSQRTVDGRWAIRIAGMALFATSAWALWMGLVNNTAPWCLTP
jgi:uncharacterized protein